MLLLPHSLQFSVNRTRLTQDKITYTHTPWEPSRQVQNPPARKCNIIKRGLFNCILRVCNTQMENIIQGCTLLGVNLRVLPIKAAK